MEYISNEQLKLLIRIQEKDSRILEIAEKQKGLPDLLSSLKVNLDKAQAEHSAASEEFDNASKERRTLEGELKTLEDKIKKLKERIPEIKKNTEYQALLKEINTVEKEKSDIEEKILILLEKIDTLKEVKTREEKVVKEEEKKFSEHKKKVEEEYSLLTEKLKEIEADKGSITSQIDSKLLAEYSRLIATKRGQAIVSVQDEHCMGCHIRIPPQIFSQIRKNDKIITCLSCSRILYWKPA